jgi:hypothetical protein
MHAFVPLSSRHSPLRIFTSARCGCTLTRHLKTVVAPGAQATVVGRDGPHRVETTMTMLVAAGTPINPPEPEPHTVQPGRFIYFMGLRLQTRTILVPRLSALAQTCNVAWPSRFRVTRIFFRTKVSLLCISKATNIPV